MAGQKQKKGKAGNAVQYTTRTQALRKLQLSLSQFRKLCIVKGIHPREPNKKTQGQHKTYYHIKDIHFLAHEPLIKKYREAAIYERKIRKARAKRNEDLARRLRARRPTYKLDHLVKERYPTFVDALRDLDDALTMVHLFATLPAEHRFKIPNAIVQTSRRLALEWQAYVVRTSSLRKTFISVKGFYFQADIMGQTVTWLVPHQLSQAEHTPPYAMIMPALVALEIIYNLDALLARGTNYQNWLAMMLAFLRPESVPFLASRTDVTQVLPADVDYRVMITFLEFYQTLLQFVNFKLYHTIGVQYPPVVDPRMERAAAGLAAIMEDLADPVKALPPSNDPELGAEAQLRLEGLQNKLHDLQQQDREDQEPAASPSHATAEDASEPEAKEEGAEGEDEAEREHEDELRRLSHSSAGPLANDDSQDKSMVGGAVAAEDDREVCASLFKGLVFYLGREVPREQLLVVIRSFGGAVGWDGEESPYEEDSQAITHQICDRPKVVQERAGREYIQPQWVVDSANFRVLVDSRLYAPGIIPPPHLSPFVDAEEEGYVPDYLATLRKMQASARSLRQQAQGIEADTAFLQDQGEPLEEGAREAAELALAERQYQKQLAKEIGGKRKAEDVHTNDSEEEAAPDRPLQAPGKGGNEDAADLEGMKKTMMKRKDRNLYQSILNRQKVKKQKVEKLEQRRAAAREAKSN